MNRRGLWLYRQRLWAIAANLLLWACLNSHPSLEAGPGSKGSDVTSPLPGAPPLDKDLVQKLRAAWKAKPSEYTPRTKHLTPGGEPQYTNRLLLEFQSLSAAIRPQFRELVPMGR